MQAGPFACIRSGKISTRYKISKSAATRKDLRPSGLLRFLLALGGDNVWKICFMFHGRGATLRRWWASDASECFNPHPAKGVTLHRSIHSRNPAISIHTPAKGVTAKLHKIILCGLSFFTNIPPFFILKIFYEANKVYGCAEINEKPVRTPEEICGSFWFALTRSGVLLEGKYFCIRSAQFYSGTAYRGSRSGGCLFQYS